jgi:hypothetical protein
VIDENETTRPEMPPPSRMDPGLAALLRKAADGELAYEEMIALRMYMDGNAMAEDRVEFERQLRSACRRTMADVRAPDDLRSRVQQLVETSRQPAHGERGELLGDQSNRPIVVRRVSRDVAEPGPYRYVGWIWSLRNIAAAIALVLAGFTAARLLDGDSRPIVATDLDPNNRFVRADMAGYLSSQLAAYESASKTDAMAAKVQFMSLQRTLVVAEDWLQQRPLTPTDDQAAGVTFAGGGQATMPGAGKAFHFRYRVNKPDEADKSQLVSVFVQQDRLEVPLESGMTYGVMGPIDTTIWVTRRDGLVYYTLAESRWAVRRAMSALGLPDASGVIKSIPDANAAPIP